MVRKRHCQAGLAMALGLLLIGMATIPRKALAIERINRIVNSTEITSNGEAMTRYEIWFTPPATTVSVTIPTSATEVTVEGPLNRLELQRVAGSRVTLATVTATRGEINQPLTLAWREAKAVSRHGDGLSLILPILASQSFPVDQYYLSISGIDLNNFHPKLVSTRINVASQFSTATNPATAEITGVGPNTSLTVAGKSPLVAGGQFSANVFAFERPQLRLIAVSSLIAVLIVAGLIAIRWAKQSVRPASRSVTRPPSALSAASVGILYRKRLDGKTLFAIFADLANRGYINCIETSRGYSFGPMKRAGDDLTKAESALLEVVLSDTITQKSFRKLHSTIRAPLYNPVARSSIALFYKQVLDEKLFVTNPYTDIIKVRLVALPCHLVGLILLLYSAIWQLSTIYYIPIAALIALGGCLLAGAHLFCRRTPQGESELADWLAFRRYLTDPHPLFDTGLFYRYLPYALVFNCEKKWWRRFRRQALLYPRWFTSLSHDTSDEVTAGLLSKLRRLAVAFESSYGPKVT